MMITRRMRTPPRIDYDLVGIERVFLLAKMLFEQRPMFEN